MENTTGGGTGWSAITVSALAQAGDRTTAEKLAGSIFADPDQTTPDRVFELYLALNRTDEGFAFLERNKNMLLRSPGFYVAPIFDAVRDDPRFLRKLDEAGLLTEYRAGWAEYLAWKKKTGQP